MPKYSFQVAAAISMHFEVEADSLVDAINAARMAPTQSLCHQCARGGEKEWNTSGEIDAEPWTEDLADVTVDGESLSGKELARAKKAWK